MSNLLRIEGEGDWIETLRSELLAGGVAVSEVHNVSLDSKQLSTPWSSPEVIELLKFVTAALQTSAATFVLLKTILPKTSTLPR
jgi:hypothetical protein